MGGDGLTSVCWHSMEMGGFWVLNGFGHVPQEFRMVRVSCNITLFSRMRLSFFQEDFEVILFNEFRQSIASTQLVFARMWAVGRYVWDKSST